MINPINEVVLSDAFNARLNALSKTTYVDSQIASVIQQLQTGDANVFNNSKIYTDDKVASLVSSAPSTLDTLNELATALGDDPNFATTMSNQIGKKADKILVPVNNNILIMDENGNLKDSGIASSNVGQLSISKDWSALQNFNAGAFVNIATNKYNASELINSYPKGYSMMWLNATNGFPITTGYGFVITFNIGTCGYQEVVEMYTGADTTVKQRRWFRTKKDANNFWQPFQEIWTSGFMGAGSTLDADKLDGKEGSYYSDYTNLVNKPDVYTKTEMNGIVNGLSTKNDLNVAINDLEIGGVNLYKGTKDFNSIYWTSQGSATLINSGNYPNFKSMLIIEDGLGGSITTDIVKQGFDFSDTSKTWTISANIAGSSSGQKVGITISTNRQCWQPQIISADKTAHILTWTFKGDGNTLQMFRFETIGATSDSPIYINRIKVEEGDKATTWTSAPEDDKAYVDAGLDNKVDKISGKSLSTNDFDNTYKSKLDGVANGATTVTASTTNGNIKINGTETNVYTHPGSGTNPHGTTKSDIELNWVTNDAQVKRIEMGVANGVATTDANNKLVQDAKTLGGLSSDKLLRADVDTTANGLITANKGIQTGNFKIDYNTDNDSLDFEYVGS